MTEFLESIGNAFDTARDAWENRHWHWRDLKRGVSEIPARYRSVDQDVRTTMLVTVGICLTIVVLAFF